ncbi:MAG: Flp pilus assembly protein CpaB [Planctomycetia bacterium]|nr:Flp pilus assembly protein CpaB [Planctomycetia bacterium]
MKPKTLILMLVAVVCGLAAAYMAMNLKGGDGDGGEKVMVVVAAVPLTNGTQIKDPAVQLTAKAFPKDIAPANFVSNPQDLNGKVIGRTIDPGTPVTLKDMSTLATLFPDNVDPNTRAFTVRVNLESSISGFLLPGARVDLLCAMHSLKDNRIKMMATFLQDVQVLAVNTQRDVPKEGGGVIPNAATITLAIKPDEVQRVAWVTDSRQVTVSLRRPGYTDKDKLTPVTGPFGEDEEGTGPSAEKPVPLPVAKIDIAPGTAVIDNSNFDKYFEIMNVPASLIRGTPIRDKAQIQGMINHFVAAGQPVTSKHLEAVASIGKTAPTPQFGRMRIVIGGQPPRFVEFENGQQVGGSNQPTPREGLPQPEGAGPAPKPGNNGKGSEGPTEGKES